MTKLFYEINDPSPPAKLETSKLFDVSYKKSNQSAIDIFLDKTIELNKLIPTSNLSGPLTSLILLGYVSAVESYFRDIIRRLILIDPASRTACEKQTLTYGAAMSHGPENLPEALLERCSFASDKNVFNAFKDFVGIKGDNPGDLKVALEDFSKVCQLRHCVVHRFGHLGSNNAIHLGLDDHKECLEKPLQIEYGPLHQIFLICINAVRTSNSYLFHKVAERTVEDGVWTWKYNRDRRRFAEYFSTFVSSTQLRKPKDAYDEFRKCHGPEAR